MYRLSRRVISQYIRSGCTRRLRLDLYQGAADRAKADAPVKDSNRPGLALLTRQSKEYERLKFAELENIFPGRIVRGALLKTGSGERAFETIELADHIDALVADRFVLEAQFEVTDSFRVAHALAELEAGSVSSDREPLKFDGLRPDILQVTPPTGLARRTITPAGRLERLSPEDPRLGLRIIDIKISGEPSPAHFAELAYYGMVLSGWLIDHGHDDRFVVLAEAAIWPGSHEGSTIDRYDREDIEAGTAPRDLKRYLDGLSADLESMPPEVVIGRVRRFLAFDLREALGAPQWRGLAWHIDSRCSGCDYLGYKWSRHESEASETDPAGPAIDGRYCWPMADAEGHLSRLAGLTEGASGKLREVNVGSVADVSALPDGSPAFERHQALRAKRTVLRQRAATLNGDLPATIADRSGTSAILPSFADIRISVSADFDVGSGLTFAFGYCIEYGVPDAFRPSGPDGPAYGRSYQRVERPLLVTERSLDCEGSVLRTWLEHMVTDIHSARDAIVKGYQENGAPTRKDASLQFFLWDRLTYDHICRVFGRHLDRLQEPVAAGGKQVSPMSWVFPAETVLQEAKFLGKSSPIAIVSDAVNSLMAAPIPHHYGVIDFANSLDPEGRKRADGVHWSFHVNKFYRDPLSDQIPSERGHEVWEKQSPFKGRDAPWHRDMMQTVVNQKLRATLYIAADIARKLRDELTAEAPQVGAVFRGSNRLSGVGDDGQIIYQHARLMAAAQRLDIELLMAMPPHEREARFKSARIDGVASTLERADALNRLGQGRLKADPAVMVLKLAARSREARLKRGEYTWSFLPEADLPDLQELTTAQFKTWRPELAAQHPIKTYEHLQKVREALAVTIIDIDRGNGLVVVKAQPLLAEAIRLKFLSMDLDGSKGRYAILDPFGMDVFSRALETALSDGIKHPPIAQTRPLFPSPRVARVASGAPHRGTVDSEAAQFIWNADVMTAAETGLSGATVVDRAERIVSGLTDRQRAAIKEATERRLSLWWGPPGTGKSRTAQAYITALASEAVNARQPLRVAIVGSTWVAIDNVARKLPELFAQEGIAAAVTLARLSSTDAPSLDPGLAPHLVSLKNARAKVELEHRLKHGNAVTIVASTVQQLAKLGGAACAPLFDVLLVDEASQLDVGQLIVGLTKLADQGRVTIIGDDKQMPPIHPLDMPEGIEHLLGSAYDFYRQYRKHEAGDHRVQPVMLNQSFRSNQEIVEFVREAGYGEQLTAAPANAALRYETERPLSSVQPADWPSPVPWSSEYAIILDPAEPLAAVVHNDRFSSQRNDDEADLVAGLVVTLFNAGLRDPHTPGAPVFSPVDFFRKGVGIVTPHRAQQAAVYDRLARIMPTAIDRNEIFATIDTVERFQGQEKTVMIASFGLGDADQIAAEETFLYSLNRFNVAASRAQAKFIAIVSRQLVDHLPRDRRALEESRLLKHYVDGFLSRQRHVLLPGFGISDLKLR